MDEQHEAHDRREPDSPYAVRAADPEYPDEPFVYEPGRCNWGEFAWTVFVLAVMGSLGVGFLALVTQLVVVELVSGFTGSADIYEHYGGLVCSVGTVVFAPIVTLFGCVFLRRKPLMRAFQVCGLTASIVVVPVTVFANMGVGLVLAVPVVLVCIVVLRFALQDEECWHEQH